MFHIMSRDVSMRIPSTRSTTVFLLKMPRFSLRDFDNGIYLFLLQIFRKD